MKRIAQWVLLSTLLVFLSTPVDGAKAADDKVYQKLEILSRVLSYIEANYIKDVDSPDLMDDAIKGLLRGLDPHTVYMPPDVFREVKVDTTGEFGGLGIEISVKDDILTVVTAIDDTPADLAGIKSGDKIIKIDGTLTKGMTLFDAVQKMRGPRGSKVLLTIQREGEKEFLEFSVKRDTIRITSVYSQLVDKEYGYLRIKNFQEKTDRELSRHLKKLKKGAGRELGGIILDLRNNPGGLLEQAVRVADHFLESGVIVSTKGRKGAFQEVDMAHREGTVPTKIPMITLVNEGSASASEIVAGALQDHGRSVLLGQTTFGKGSVQTIIDLEDGSGLKLTIAQYYTPKGRSIQALGITPDISISPVEPDGQEVNYVREKDLQGHFESEETKKSSAKKKLPETAAKKGAADFAHDVQLRRALEYLKTWEVFRASVAPKIPPA